MAKSSLAALAAFTLLFSAASQAADKDDGDINYLKYSQVSFNKADLGSTARKIPESMRNKSPISSTSAAAPSPKTSETTPDKPLVVIRHNQPYVHYEMQLYNALKKAVEVKPDASFDIISLIPSTGSESLDDQNKQMAAENGNKLLQHISEIGIPSSQVKLKHEGSNQVAFNEFRIFVK